MRRGGKLIPRQFTITLSLKACLIAQKLKILDSSLRVRHNKNFSEFVSSAIVKAYGDVLLNNPIETSKIRHILRLNLFYSKKEMIKEELSRIEALIKDANRDLAKIVDIEAKGTLRAQNLNEEGEDETK